MKKKVHLTLLLLFVFAIGFTQNQIVQIGNSINGVAADDYSGSVAISSNGNTIAVGAHSNDSNGSLSGHVRVFENINKTWTQIGNDIEGEDSGNYSGDNLAINSDGNIVAIASTFNKGINGTQSGHVRVFENINNAWTQIGNDIDGEAEHDFSGRALALSADGNILAIGAISNDVGSINQVFDAGHVRVYKNVNGSWLQLGSDIDGESQDDFFGISVDLSSNGNIMAIGAIHRDANGQDSGYVKVYENINSTWTQIGADINGEAANDGSGIVTLSSDGTTVAIGASLNDGGTTNSDKGHVRIFKNINANWTQIGGDIDGEDVGEKSGSVIDLSSNGNILAIGAYNNDDNGTNAGNVRIFQNQSNTWVNISGDISGSAAQDFFGGRLSLSSDGAKIAIGATGNDDNGSNSGQVKIYDISMLYNVHIPDVNFKNALLTDTSINTNGDNEISITEALAVTGNIHIPHKSISDLTGIEEFMNITNLTCTGNNLTSLDVTQNTVLEYLWCDDNNLTSLDVTQNLALENLNFFSNSITTIDLSKNTALTNLNTNKNGLNTLDIGDNIALKELYCSDNNLTVLDISNNISLTHLTVDRCNLSVLDLTTHTYLQLLYCDSNNLTDLDLSKNSALTALHCSYNNSLSRLNVANGNNSAITSPFSFGVLASPALSCIQVDDVNHSTTNWTNIDTNITFSVNCNNDLSTNNIATTDYNIYPNPVSTTLNVSTSLNIQKVEIYTLLGTKVITTSTTAINVASLKSGLYILKLYDESGKTATSKFLKQ